MKLKIFATALFGLVAMLPIHVSSAWAQSPPRPDLSGNNPQWLEDPNSQCWAYEPTPGPGTISWSGNCVSNLAQGPGTLRFQDSNGVLLKTETGSFENGVEIGVADIVFYLGNGTPLSFKAMSGPPNFAPIPYGEAIYNGSQPGHWVQGDVPAEQGPIGPPDGVLAYIVLNFASGPYTFVLDNDQQNTDQQNAGNTLGSRQDQQSSDSMQSLIGQEQQNLNDQIQHLQSMPNQVRQSELQTQQILAQRNESHAAPPPAYVPPPAPVYSPPPPASQVANNGTDGANTAPPATACVSGFYNSQIYGWWNWKNTCSFTVAVFSQLRTAAYGGENTVIPGNLQSGNTGLSPDEVNAGGGYVYAACPDGYTAIDNATGQLWNRNTVSFHCRRS